MRKRDHRPDVIEQVESLGVTGLIVAPWTIVPTENPSSLRGRLVAMDTFATQFLASNV